MVFNRKQVTDKTKKRMGDADYIAHEMYRKNVELAHTNQTLSLLRTIDNLVLEPDNSIDELAQGIATALVADTNYQFSAVFMKISDENAHPMVLRGFGHLLNDTSFDFDSIKEHNVSLHTPWFDSSEHTRTIDLTISKDLEIKELFSQGAHVVEKFITKLNCHTLCLVKLQSRRGLVGTLVIGLSAAAREINVDDFSHLGRIGEAAGIAIDNKLLFEENKQVLRKLQQSNQKLMALDEAKDEFVSMASHQLRTPLTSIKGYISMVLEGDAGEINETQRQMLAQAFFSSQRMVYLISDLLNVSRLKTGKFLIETRPVYLPDLVDGEISQLVDGAAAKNLTLSFQKPKAFPTLKLDDMKIRQVVMNFTDNAIYYTPAGGKITVELKEKY